MSCGPCTCERKETPLKDEKTDSSVKEDVIAIEPAFTDRQIKDQTDQSKSDQK